MELPEASTASTYHVVIPLCGFAASVDTARKQHEHHWLLESTVLSVTLTSQDIGVVDREKSFFKFSRSFPFAHTPFFLFFPLAKPVSPPMSLCSWKNKARWSLSGCFYFPSSPTPAQRKLKPVTCGN